MFKEKELKIEMAEQEAIKFNYTLIELFIIKILKIKGGFFISDRSYVSDMRSYNSLHCKQISENEWEYTSIMYKQDPNNKKKFWELDEEEKAKLKKVIVHKLTRDEVSFDDDLIKDTFDLFGVCITDKDLNGSFVDLGIKLGKGISAEKRAELTILHSKIDE